MRSHDDSKLPPLPDEARFALAAFRAERPSPHQEERLHGALQAAESGRALPGRPRVSGAPRRTSPQGRALWVVTGAALAAVLLTLGVERAWTVSPTQDSSRDGLEFIHEALPQREVAFQVPEGGGWVVLPWTLGRHPAGTATVHLETPAELEFQEHASHLPAVQLVGCEGDRCMHRFTAATGAAAEPLRVRIHRPGRYVFNISHASQVRHIDESFVVTAAPEPYGQ